MKRLILFVVLGAFALATAAQTEGETEVRIHGYQIELPVHPHPVFPSDIDAYTGMYDLSNGATMTLRRNGLQMYVQIGNGERKKLVAAQSNVFVALDRKLKITLDNESGGEVVMAMPSTTAQAERGQFVRVLASR